MGADVVRTVRKAASSGRNWSGVLDPTGVQRAGHVHIGVLQERGRSCHLHLISGWAPAVNRSAQAIRSCVRNGMERTRNAQVVPPSEGNEVRRDGWQEVGASNSTVESGEFLPWETPWKEGDAKSWNR